MSIMRSETARLAPVPTVVENNVISFDGILAESGLRYKSIEYYWQIGELDMNMGWILHLSVVKPQIQELIKLILPKLLPYNIPFKIIRNIELANYNLEGMLGVHYLGKIISIYPRNNDQAVQLATELITLTKNFKGPCVPSARLLKGIIYTEFVQNNPTPFSGHIKRNLVQKSDAVDIANWPFYNLASTDMAKHQSPKLLNFKYYPIALIKKDTKGDVQKYLYFKGPWKVNSCIIKQGKSNMLFDDAGRDVQDRLRWQFHLHQLLFEQIHLPKPIDLFSENGDTFFVMEFIKGSSLTSVLNSFYSTSNWGDLPPQSQILLTGYLLQILHIIELLHKNGFIHRDIMPENFLIDKNKKLWLLDVELMWSIDKNQPNPPFQFGTLGFSSPQQHQGITPSFEDDIYALGALMLNLFTNLHPIKLHQVSAEQLSETLLFLTQEPKLSKLICNCLAPNPSSRPVVKHLIGSITLYRNQLEQKQNPSKLQINSQNNISNYTELRRTINAAIQGLVHPVALSPQQVWVSNLQIPKHQIINPVVGLAVYPGWHTGAAGPLWLLAIARINGFEAEDRNEVYIQNWKYITEEHYRNTNRNASLYTGDAGIALALFAAFESRLLSPNNEELRLENLFSKDQTILSLAEGLAGQGLALLQIKQRMDTNYTDELLDSYINHLLNTQHKDGSWGIKRYHTLETNTILTLDNGIPGIIWFLLHYLDAYPDDNVLELVVKACNWLVKSARYKSKDRWVWSTMDDGKASTHFSTAKGIPGIILVLIKAFQVTGKSIYRDIAISNLNNLPEHPHFSNFTISDGLAGLGELYLEAYKVFKDQIWLHRAGWIEQLFLHTFQWRSSSDGYWLMDVDQTFTADLFTGNAGVIHFLMHYLSQEKMRHPLCGNIWKS